MQERKLGVRWVARRCEGRWDLVLVTRNLRDFASVAGLKLDSWFTA